MSRTNPTSVSDMLGSNLAPNANVEPFIGMANTLTTNLKNIALKNKKVTIDADTLEKIECLLSCHFYGIQDQFFQTKSTGKASATFQGQTGMNLEASQYGQMAMVIDYTRVLAAMNKGGILGVTWLGTACPAETDQ